MVDVGVQRSEPNTVISAIEAPYRIGILIAMLAAAVAGLFFLEPESQSAAYHGFIDTRSWLGIPNFGDVVSNLPFALVGGWGLWQVFGPAGRYMFDDLADRWPYVFFLSASGW